MVGDKELDWDVNAVLREIAQALSERVRVRTSLDRVLGRLTALLGVHSAWVFQYDAARRSYVWIGGTGLPPALSANGCQELCSGWCECQERFDERRLDRAINFVQCSRLERAKGEKQGLVMHASVPLRGEERALGILNVAAGGSDPFSHRMLHLLSLVGHQLAMALEREALTESLAQSAERLRALVPWSHSLAAVTEEEQLWRATVDMAIDELGFPSAGILGDAGEVLCSRSSSPSLAPANPLPYSYRTDDECAQVRHATPSRLCEQTGSSMQVPIVDSGWQLCVESTEIGAFTELDFQLLTTLATYAGAAFRQLTVRAQMVVAATWVERRKIAADLHDAVSQRLFSASLLLQSALLASEWLSETARPALTKAADLIAESQTQMREVVYTLHETHDVRSVGSYVRDQTQRLALLKGLQVNVHIAADPPLVAGVRTTVCKIIDEALQNALRHGRPTVITLSLRQRRGRFRITIRDDGCGFESSTVVAGLGLSSMRERAAMVGAKLVVQSALGMGTVIALEVPVVG